jgi:2-polyprenyl-3-methyl-5-hydroxy-6-metoxy-1,4-benzoquinol methylase
MDGKPGEYLAADYGAKSAAYFASARRDWIDLLAPDPRAAFLELGCGAGATGALALKDGKCGTYVGIEMSASAAEIARSALTEVHVGNVDDLKLPYKPETFDVLLCGEVLEHLVDPEKTLGRLVALLKPGGRMFASVPNVAQWSVLIDLMRGRFDYTDQGVMDRTHLRWFTPKTFRAMITNAGINVDRLAPLDSTNKLYLLTRWLPLNHLLWVQIDMHGHKPLHRHA